jgi:hypothetical protein
MFLIVLENNKWQFDEGDNYRPCICAFHVYLQVSVDSFGEKISPNIRLADLKAKIVRTHTISEASS